MTRSSQDPQRAAAAIIHGIISAEPPVRIEQERLARRLASDVLTSEMKSHALDPDIIYIFQNVILIYLFDEARIIDAICGGPVFRSKDQSLPYILPLIRSIRAKPGSNTLYRCKDVRASLRAGCRTDSHLREKCLFMTQLQIGRMRQKSAVIIVKNNFILLDIPDSLYRIRRCSSRA